MKKVEAFKIEGDNSLYATERAAREAEFDRLYVKIHAEMGSVRTDGGYVGLAQSIASNLRSNIYPSAADAFLAAADYFREHRDVLTGKVPSSETPT